MGDPLAQSVEHNTFNVGVLGSNPKRITKKEAFGPLFLFAWDSHPRVLSVASLGESVSKEPSANPERITKKRDFLGLSFSFL